MKSCCIALLFSCTLFQAGAHSPAGTENGKPAALAAPALEPGIRYLLGSDDEVAIWVADVPELSNNAGRALTIDSGGFVNIPMAGRMAIAGLTAAEAEKAIAERLKLYIKNPQVTVSLTQMRSRPVSVVGSVNSPGVHQIRGEKPLLEVIAMAGGLRNDAGSMVTLTRPIENGPIPLPFAAPDPAGKFSVAEISLSAMMRGDHPEYNTPVMPNDVISVHRAEMVYVVGDVVRSGGFVLNEKKSLSVLQALSLAGGIARTAAPGKSKIIRGGIEDPNNRVEVAVDLKRILSGKQQDVPLYPDDVLFVPDNGAKKIAVRSAEAVLQTLTGILIFRGGN